MNTTLPGQFIKPASGILIRLVVTSILPVLLPVHAYGSCNEDEQQLIVAYTQCFLINFSGGSCPELQELGEQLQTELSQACKDALAQAQLQQQGIYPYQPGTAPLPNIYDQGDGNYIVPGVGACVEGGCMSFD